jgi:predicted metal-dependent hydrolase
MAIFEQLNLFASLFPAHETSSAEQPSPPIPKTRFVIGHERQHIEFHLRRSKRRTIGLLIDDRGLTVTAPKWVSLGEIDAAVVERSTWISKKMLEWRQHQAKRLAKQTQWSEGGQVQYLGESLTIRIRADLTGTRREGSELFVGLPTQASDDRIKDTVQAWLQSEARQVFGERLDRLAMLTGKAPKRWGLSSARTRWGSCNADGSIRLNWRLMHHSLDAIDYVIAHELAHLNEMNHSPKFWDRVAEIMPDYEQAKAKLHGSIEAA